MINVWVFLKTIMFYAFYYLISFTTIQCSDIRNKILYYYYLLISGLFMAGLTFLTFERFLQKLGEKKGERAQIYRTVFFLDLL